MANAGSVEIGLAARLAETLFDQLHGTWRLERQLQSMNNHEPLGECVGSATLVSREPSVFIDEKGTLQLAAKEMIYSEQGYFQSPNTGFTEETAQPSFSRKYIWRLQRQKGDSYPQLSVWFTKPGTETIDYLFHKLNIVVHKTGYDDPNSRLQLEGSGGHLCQDDIYSSSYTFEFDVRVLEPDITSNGTDLRTWTMVHETITYGHIYTHTKASSITQQAENSEREYTIENFTWRFIRMNPNINDQMSHMVGVELPQPFADIPRHPLLFGPSPIQALPRISAALGGKVAVYAKREDCNSGIAYGGNKVRKLEYLISEALSQGCDTLVSIGGFQSNHTRQVGGVAAALGLKAKLVQEKWVEWEDPGYAKVGNIQLSRLMGADVRLDESGFGIEHKDTLRRLFDEVKDDGGKPYYIPAGASDHPLGGLGFARWAFEVCQQEKSMGVFFDTIVVCAVTGSTFAGMIAGFKLIEKQGLSSHRKIIGVDASAKPQETLDQVLRIAKQTGLKIGLKEDDIGVADIVFETRFHGGVYGIPDQATIDAIKFGASVEAFITDPVYEGKSLAAMMAMIQNGEIPAGSNLLYAHLGGQLALNAYSELR